MPKPEFCESAEGLSVNKIGETNLRNISKSFSGAKDEKGKEAGM